MELPPRFDVPTRYPIRKLAARLRHRSPIYRWLEANWEPQEESAAKLLQILEESAECNWRDRAVAYHVLGLIELDEEERAHAVELLAAALKKPEIEHLSFARFFGAMGKTALAFWLFFSALALASHSSLPDIGGITCISLVSTPFALLFQEQNWTRMTKRIAATALTTVGTPACIELLWQQINPFRQEGAAERESLEALKAILPQVTGEWYGYLSPGTDTALTELISSSNNIDLSVAALTALGQAGSGRSAKAVERLSKRARSNRIREHAAAILPTLLARHENEKSAATLLRPSAPGHTDHLVRPVYGGDPDTTNLLRASQSDDPSKAGTT